MATKMWGGSGAGLQETYQANDVRRLPSLQVQGLVVHTQVEVDGTEMVARLVAKGRRERNHGGISGL
jgi:hypothetical protein